MASVNLRQIAWWPVIRHALYVWIIGLAALFVIGLLDVDPLSSWARLPLLLVGLATIWAGSRVALRGHQQPLLHGFLLGLLVGLLSLILSLTAAGLTRVDLPAFLLDLLGGLLGGRVAQRMLSPSEHN